MYKKILFFVSVVLVFSSCEKEFLEPAIENNRDLSDIQDEPGFALGLLYNGYTRLPGGWSFSEMATDDAVSSDEDNNYSNMATGQWAENFNPVDQWQNSFAAIQYLNLMLSKADTVTYAENPAVNQMFKDRTKGEVYGLRAYFMHRLLQAHGGMAGGQLLGVPIMLEPQDASTDFSSLQRATFEEGIQQIYSDIEKAIELLPLDYEDIGNQDGIPAKYVNMGAGVNDYNRVLGKTNRLRMTERVALGIRSRAALLAASPAFNQGTSTTWADAANYAADVLDRNGGDGGLDPDGLTWYNDGGVIDNLAAGLNPPEILWRANMPGPSSTLEEQLYPPSLFGDGLVNPTQNLVNAFPMANGYPIDHPDSGYDPANPYVNRDPRLTAFIVVNGSQMGPFDETIITAVDGGTIDGLNIVESSTRTGYYLRKLLREDVNLDPQSVNQQRHINPLIRYTEIYLNYAEAANEAWGPMGTGGNSYSAYDVIRAIRERAGLSANGGDLYLESIKGDQDAMRELIRNERRLELSFEGFRFWDLRRWNEDLSEMAFGDRIEDGNHEVISVEPRLYSDYMIYGPIPYSEVLKFGLIQNMGW
ncbi:RagB/SusD family nutrient uptake outer membrane protein [Salinimicrobium sp. MT39]|uniref:RagB/SusD family nutrient uptake outer membrane protein n=1 Tax=Salinimicrobium profundisediminis TaxID=2994553 RepID=A0A9X3HZQ4_9FLAO|nr:RagB/SusD family nutrient uptake outer membrane protein [Salinimicrobium profundisediminis]MCX2836648.1 RagB/SusD family nutrient uptake outer membrane protein [Salinimicrobium profundisediminis]